MPDEKGNELADEGQVPSTPLHAHGDGREEDVEGTIVDEDAGLDDVTKTAALDDEESAESRDADDAAPSEEDVGEEGLGTQSGAIGGGDEGDADLSETTSAPMGPLDDQR